MRRGRLNRPAGGWIKRGTAVGLHLSAVARRASALHHGAAIVSGRRRRYHRLACTCARRPATRVTAAIAAIATRAILAVAAIDPIDPVSAAMAFAASLGARLVLHARI